jgi:hypothetical protein
LLPITASLQFVPVVQPPGSTDTAPATLTFRAWDQTAGTTATLFSISSTGGASSISTAEVTASLPVKFVKHAPTWIGSGASLTAELPGSTNPPGDTVAAIFGNSFQDADGRGPGVAIVGVTGKGDGFWQYSRDGGASWTSFGFAGTTFGIPTSSNALLLPGDAVIRFVPTAGFTGTASLQAYAWDSTTGTAAAHGATRGFKITVKGGNSAFSAALMTATILIDTAPVLVP